jgi:hypothetical protein
MRHPRPNIVVDYYAKIDAARGLREPKCCHTCALYQENGICQEFSEEPPAEFAAQLDQCQEWICIVPF